MKLKRTKLAALALSAVMVVSAISPYVYAEESSSEAAAEETTEVVEEEVAEVAAEEEAVEAEEEPAAEEVADSQETAMSLTAVQEEDEDTPSEAVVDTDSEYTFNLDLTYETEVNDGGEDVVTGFKAVISAISTTGTTLDTATFTASGTQTSATTVPITYTVEFTAPTCKAEGAIKITASYVSHESNGTVTYEYIAGSAKTSGTDSSSVKGFAGNIDETSLKTLLSHTEVKTTNFQYVEVDEENNVIKVLSASEVAALTCSSAAAVQYEVKCSVCGASLGYGEVEILDAVGHSYSNQTTRTAVVIGSDSNINHATSGTPKTDLTIVDEEGYVTGTIESATVYTV